MNALSRVACVLVQHFAAAAHERCEPGLRDRPLAVVTGTAPARRVVEASAVARAGGIVPGLTETEARTRMTTLVTRPLSEELIASAQGALLEVALGVSPRVEDGGPGIVTLDLGGLGRLFGTEPAMAHRLVRMARGVGLEAVVGIAGTRAAARLAAQLAAAAGHPSRVLVAGDERAALGAAPLAMLELSPDVDAMLRQWGVRTVSELAALPRDGLAVRLGPPGLRAHDLALGVDREPFRAWMPPPFWLEAQGVDWEIVSWEGLAPVIGAVLARLTTRLEAGHVWADTLAVDLGLAGGGHDERTIALASPLRDPKPMVTLIALELEARPPAEPVIRVAVSARAVTAEAVQGRLGERPAPSARDLAETLARLAGVVGRENLGSPVLLDSHRADAFVLSPFLPANVEPGPGSPRARGALGVSGALSGPPMISEPVNESKGRGAPRLCRGASERWGVWGAVSGPPMFSEERSDDSRLDVGPLAFRRLRPPRRVQVAIGEREPVSVRFHDALGGISPPQPVVACAGPWRTSGEWWAERAWARDEWDVALADGMLCRLVRDRLTGDWFLDGAYD